MSYAFTFRIFALGLCVAAFGGSACAWAKTASESDPALKLDWEKRLISAKARQQEGKTKQAEAKKVYETEKVACFKKFLVTDCQEGARKRYLVSTNEGRRIENEGLAAERQIKKEQLDDRNARYQAEAPQRAADRAEREAKVAEERKISDEKRARKLAERQQKAPQGAERRARDAERLKKKKARHEKKVAEQMEKAKQRPIKADNSASQ